MAADPRLANLPALRGLAEEEARAHYEAYGLAYSAIYPAQTLRPWGAYHGDRDAEIAAHLALLCDLDLPASRDAVARLVAERAKIRLWAVHLLLLGGTEYPPEWPPSLTDALASATGTEALTLIALHVLGRSDADR